VRDVLGAAAVDAVVLADLVSAQLGVDSVRLESVTAEVAPYDLEALTTAGRYWVHGTATTPDGTGLPYRFFVKVVQSWERSPFFQMVPEAMRAEALAMIPWEREPAVYRSDLGDLLPDGLTMPAARRVAEVDDLSAAVWLDAVDVQPVRWDVPRLSGPPTCSAGWRPARGSRRSRRSARRRGCTGATRRAGSPVRCCPPCTTTTCGTTR